MKRRTVGIAVRAVIVSDKRVLLTRHRHPERRIPEFWCFPGGHVEQGETLSTALQREIWEETGLTITPGGIVYIQDFPERNLLDIFLSARLKNGQLRLGFDPEPGAQHLVAVRWFPLRNLPSLTVLPQELADLLAKGVSLPEIPLNIVPNIERP